MPANTDTCGYCAAPDMPGGPHRVGCTVPAQLAAADALIALAQDASGRPGEARTIFLADLVCTAVEGATGYWAAVSAYKWTDGPANTRATLVDEDTGETYALTIDAVALGIERIERREVTVNATIRAGILAASAANDAGQLDADDADVIAQAGLLGNIVYG